MLTDGQWLSERRRQGKDWEFAWYLSGQRMKIAKDLISRDLVEPWAVPVLDWLTRVLHRRK